MKICDVCRCGLGRKIDNALISIEIKFSALERNNLQLDSYKLDLDDVCLDCRHEIFKYIANLKKQKAEKEKV
jgi:hypothetical protein